jgi:Phosphoribosylformylglycinamidine (FGAM) synthase, synthetase domain
LRVPSAFPRPGLAIYVVGETFAELGGSEFAEAVLGVVTGKPPALDPSKERALLRFLVAAAGGAMLASAHDCGDGGLVIALLESAIGGGTASRSRWPGDLPSHVALFSESASRAIVSVDPADEEALVRLAAEHGVPVARLGETEDRERWSRVSSISRWTSSGRRGRRRSRGSSGRRSVSRDRPPRRCSPRRRRRDRDAPRRSLEDLARDRTRARVPAERGAETTAAPRARSPRPQVVWNV